MFSFYLFFSNKRIQQLFVKGYMLMNMLMLDLIVDK